MILQCSRGHKYDTVEGSVWHRDFYDGMHCPMLLNYDRIGGSVYCRRVLHEVSKIKKKNSGKKTNRR
jgi:hypothetical protein